MDFWREPNVMSNANPTQIRHLQAVDGGAGLRVRLLGPMTITNAGSSIGIDRTRGKSPGSQAGAERSLPRSGR